jgi:myo-inositol-1-phosphate synthase
MKQKVDKVVVLWSANTEMYMLPELSDVLELKSKIDRNLAMPASVLFCVAAIEEKVLYLNGSP